MKKLSFVGVFIGVLFSSLSLFGQTPDAIVANTDSTSIKTESVSQVPDFLKNLDTPKIIKNNVRVNNMIITKTEIDAKNQIIVEGIVEIRNYADTPTSRLYMVSYLGIKGAGHYMEYPFYNDVRSEAFILEPKQVVTREFRVVEDNFLAFGAAGIEVAIFDEYDKRVHAEASSISEASFPTPKSSGTLFTDFDVRLMVGDKKFILSTGPTFYPETEDMFLNLDFRENVPNFLKNISVKVYKKNFFTSPIKEFDAVITEPITEETVFNIPFPEDLPPGVYPIHVKFEMENKDIKMPHVYGRFIVGGNMVKTTDVVLNISDNSVQGITFIAQGNPPDITNPDRARKAIFSAQIEVLQKDNKILFSKKIEEQAVDIYKNIDIGFDAPIRQGKIQKVRVTLSNNTGAVFSIYEKDFDGKEVFNYWILLYILGGALLLWLLLKSRSMHTISILFVFSLIFISSPISEAAIFPQNDIGFIVSDSRNVEDDEISYNDFWWCWWRYFSDSYCNIDLDVAPVPNILDRSGIEVTIDQPNFDTCYPINSTIPVAISASYTLCSNTPLYCAPTVDPVTGVGTPCTSSEFDASDDYLYMYASYDYIGHPASYESWYPYYQKSVPWYSYAGRDWELKIEDIGVEAFCLKRSPFGVSQACLEWGAGRDISTVNLTTPVYDEVNYLKNFLNAASINSANDSLGGWYPYHDPELYFLAEYFTPYISPSVSASIYNEDEILLLQGKMKKQPLFMKYLEFEMNGWEGSTRSEYSIIAPPTAGQYSFFLKTYFTVKGSGKAGTGYYLAEFKLNICDASYTCQGATPPNTDLCTGDDTGLTSNVNRSVVSACGATKCEYTCSVGYYNNAGVCTPNICNTTTPSANSVSCGDGPVPTTNNAPNTLVNTCSISTQCDWVCSAGYYNNAGVCTPYTGTAPCTLCNTPIGGYNTVTAEDGRCWLAINLGGTTRFNGGYYQWMRKVTGSKIGWNASTSDSQYGDPCPVGSHTPSKAEWETLISYVGTSNIGSFNESSILGLWQSHSDPSRPQIGTWGYYWTSTRYDADIAYIMFSGTFQNTVGDYSMYGDEYIDSENLVRCIVDASICPNSNYTLTINTAGTGGGTTTGTGTYTSGASVTATATPNASSTFIGWSGDCNTSGQVTMNADKTCTATFTAIPPPETPTGLNAAQSTCGNNWLNLSWNASVGATNYKVYRGATKVYDGPLLAFSDLALTLGTTYTYTIEATNAGGTSARSAPVISGTVNIVCPDLTTSITSPTAATLNTPLNFTATITSANAGTGTGFNTLFQVSTLPNGGGTVSVISVNSRAALTANTSGPVTSSSYTFTATGEYSVRACTDNNASFIGVITESNELNNCSPTWTTVKVPPETPTGLNAAQSTCGNNWLNLSWNASVGATNYKVYRGATKVYDGPLLVFSDTGLTLGTTYTYTIEATNAGGTSARSAPAVSGTVSNACPVSPDLTAGAPTPNAAILSTALTFNATISNANSPTGAGFNNFFQVTNVNGYNPDVPTPDPAKIDDKPSTPMGALAAGGSSSTTTAHTFTTAGTYYIRACADKTDRNNVGVITESDENNNCGQWISVTVTSNVTNASCGTAAKTYLATQTTYDTTPEFCNLGTPPTPNPAFPTPGNTVTWTCTGSGGGSDSLCSASQDEYQCTGTIPLGHTACPGTPAPTGNTTPYIPAATVCANVACTYSKCPIGEVYNPTTILCDNMPLNGCFTDSNASNVNLTNYPSGPTNTFGLINRVQQNKLGYMLTDPTRNIQTQTFRTKLAGNINKYITSRYYFRPITVVDNTWQAYDAFSAPVIRLNNTQGVPNPSGYFYYSGSGSERLLTLKTPLNGPITINKPTVLYVVGADVYIKENIRYSTTSGDNSSLVIIVQKDSSNNGGNIYIDPAVTHIDGTLIADGALMNWDGVQMNNGKIDPLNWKDATTLLNKRLLINGRLMTYNTRGGALKTDLTTISGLDAGLNPLQGKCANGMTMTDCDWQYAAAQDLERFRMIPSDSIETCSLYVTNTIPARKPDILTTVLD